MQRRALSLSARVVLINGTLFAVGTAVLALSPATVSQRPVVSELVVLVAGLLVMFVANALLVRGHLRPFDALVQELASASGERLAVRARGPAREVALAVNDLLHRIEQAGRASDMAALSAQEAERSRIAQELHDGVGQSLTAVLLELGRRADPSLDHVRDGVRASLQEVRAAARQLRPHVLQDLGLRSALAALTTELFAALPTHVRRGIAPGLPELEDTTELVVFRVAQEALTNVARHARASEVRLTLTTRGDHVVLEVADDGIGLPPGASGSGLRGMAERAALVGGTLSLERRDGGTVVHLEVPLTQSTP